MEKGIFIKLIIVCVSTHIIRSIYEILKHKEVIKPGKLSFIIMFINMILLWVSWVMLCNSDADRIDLPVIVHYFGLLICIAGVLLFLTALLTIKTLESYDGDLISTGIYSKIRHPMYLGFLFWLIGFPIYFGAIYSIFLSLLFIMNILFWRYLEEKELVKRFPFYSEYRRKTIF